MIVYLSLGSNIGDKQNNIKNAISLISKNIGKTIHISSFYKSKAWGFDSDNYFINNAIKINTKLNPDELLSAILKIEKALGRARITTGYSDRVIDIDIIFYENLIVNEPNLKIPHPLLQDRNFVLLPLNEIAKDFTHPRIKKSVSTLLSECKDTSLCKIIY